MLLFGPSLLRTETKQWRELGTASGKAFADITDFYIDAYYNLDIDKRGCAPSTIH